MVTVVGSLEATLYFAETFWLPSIQAYIVNFWFHCEKLDLSSLFVQMQRKINEVTQVSATFLLC